MDADDPAFRARHERVGREYERPGRYFEPPGGTQERRRPASGRSARCLAADARRRSSRAQRTDRPAQVRNEDRRAGAFPFPPPPPGAHRLGRAAPGAASAAVPVPLPTVLGTGVVRVFFPHTRKLSQEKPVLYRRLAKNTNRPPTLFPCHTPTGRQARAYPAPGCGGGGGAPRTARFTPHFAPQHLSARAP